MATETEETASPKLVDMAVELEAKRIKELSVVKLTPTAVASVERLLQGVVFELQPTDRDARARSDMLSRLTNLVYHLDICRGATVVPFGSFTSNLYTPWGDLDVCLVVPNEPSVQISKSRRLNILRSIRDALYMGGGASRIQVLPQPRVPLLMFEDTYWNVSCDVSVSNSSAVVKSHVLRFITDIDPRCRALVFLVKCWAKAQCINDPKLGTLNSYALSLLVIFHLQTRDPPILPPLQSAIVQGILEPDECKLSNCVLRLQTFARDGFGRRNRSSVSELFRSFFVQFASVEHLWLQGLVVCTSSGKWGDRSTSCPDWAAKGYPMMVEDPFDLTDNCARSVHEGSLQLIFKAFSMTAELLYKESSYWLPAKLREILFSWPVGYPRPGLQQSSSPDPRPGLAQLQNYIPRVKSRMNPRIQKRLDGQKDAKLRKQRKQKQPEVAGTSAEQPKKEQETGEAKHGQRAREASEGASAEQPTGQAKQGQASEGEDERGDGDGDGHLHEQAGEAAPTQTRKERPASEDEVLYSIRRLFFTPSSRHRHRRRWPPSKRKLLAAMAPS